MDPQVRDVQSALVQRGYALKVDGIYGRMTQAAIADFQAKARLQIVNPGSIGPKTLKALGLSDRQDEQLGPIWLKEARRFLGLHERRDAAILDKALHLDASEIAWCGAFTAMVLASTLTREPLPNNPLGARNWTKFGQALATPQLGAVAVFWRGSKDGWQGHVGFVVGHDASYLHILGGNQSDSVSIARLDKARLLGYRWPSTGGAAPSGVLPHTTINATITTNEA